MNDFILALLATGPSPLIPAEKNVFGFLIGTWDFDWLDNKGRDNERHVQGEWIFSWVLEGIAIQDIFICPSRTVRKEKTYPDASYGTTLRIYNTTTETWNVFYGENGQTVLLEIVHSGDTIVLKQTNPANGMIMQWQFSDMTEISFHWENLISQDSGNTWNLVGELFATKRN